MDRWGDGDTDQLTSKLLLLFVWTETTACYAMDCSLLCSVYSVLSETYWYTCSRVQYQGIRMQYGTPSLVVSLCNEICNTFIFSNPAILNFVLWWWVIVELFSVSPLPSCVLQACMCVCACISFPGTHSISAVVVPHSHSFLTSATTAIPTPHIGTLFLLSFVGLLISLCHVLVCVRVYISVCFNLSNQAWKMELCKISQHGMYRADFVMDVIFELPFVSEQLVRHNILPQVTWNIQLVRGKSNQVYRWMKK